MGWLGRFSHARLDGCQLCGLKDAFLIYNTNEISLLFPACAVQLGFHPVHSMTKLKVMVSLNIHVSSVLVISG